MKVWIVFDEEEQEGGYLLPYRTVNAVVDSEEKAIKKACDSNGKLLAGMDYEEHEIK